MALTLNELEIITKQRDDLVTTISEQAITGDGISKTLSSLIKAEGFNKSQWNKYHLYISQYEKELLLLIGEKVIDPLSENDIQNLARSIGRLYQNPVSTSAKKIPQFSGNPVSRNTIFELSNKTKIDDILSLLLSGTGNSGTATDISSSYTQGDSNINLTDPINAGWILVGGATLLKVGSSTSSGSCSLPQYGTQVQCLANGGSWSSSNSVTILDRINDASYSNLTSVSPSWGGFTNAERLSKSSGVTQGIMNSLVSSLNLELNIWKLKLTTAQITAIDNKAPNMRQIDLDNYVTDLSYLNNYISSGLPLEDGASGIDGLKDKILNRLNTISQRSLNIKRDKSEYYSSRYGFTNSRSDVQSGTLKRILFLEGIAISGGFSSNGTKEQQTQLSNLNKILASA